LIIASEHTNAPKCSQGCLRNVEMRRKNIYRRAASLSLYPNWPVSVLIYSYY